MLSVRFIVNPAAGAGRTGREWPQIQGLIKNCGMSCEHDMTEAPGHAVELAKSAAEGGYDMVVSVGGDGTMNEVVNGLYQAGRIGDIMLGIVSTGTGGDYIRTVGIPRQYEAACRCFLQPRKLAVDIGVVEYMNEGHTVRRLFVNFAGLGFDAEIVRRTTQIFKSVGSTASYLLGLLTTLLFYKNREISIIIDGQEVTREVCTVVMNNGRYGGGGMLTAPDADLADGLLDVLIIGNLNKADLLWSLPRIYKGTHLTHPKVEMKKAREIEIRNAGAPLYLQADGELLGQVPARFCVLPAALNIVV